MRNIKISVVIATYQRPEMLCRAIESVLAQTYENYEIIVVDDNDPNSEFRKSTQLCMSRYSENEKIKYLMMESNSGACAARNKGASVASGDYLNFLDDDDEFLPEKFEFQVKLINDSDEKLGVVGCFANIVNGNNEIIGVEKTELRGDVFYNQLCQNIATTSIALVEKKSFLVSGGWEKMHSSQEHWMLSKVLSVNPMYDYVPKELVIIHHHDGERISTNPGKPLGAIELSKKVEQFFDRLTTEQIRQVKIKMIDNIMMAYAVTGDLRNYRHYFFQRLKLAKRANVNQFLQAFLGISFYEYILRIRRLKKRTDA